MRNILMAISGPSGVGKGTLVKELISARTDVAVSVSCTTRAPREGEKDGKDYFFLTREEFLRRAAEGEFLEYDEHFGNYYGTPKSFVRETLREKSVILEIDVVGALNAKKVFPDCVLIMIVPPSAEELKNGFGAEIPRRKNRFRPAWRASITSFRRNIFMITSWSTIRWKARFPGWKAFSTRRN